VSNSDIIHEDPGLSVRVERDGETLVVSALGELDSSNAQTLERELRLAIASGIPELFLDLGGVSFIDSAGLRVLAVIARLSRRNGERLRMLPGSPPVELAIEATGLERPLPLLD
jgi:anti-sigma B factor antagonist